jgi:hypothetical protein
MYQKQPMKNKYKFEDISNNLIYADLLGVPCDENYQELIDILDSCFKQPLIKNKSYSKNGKYYYYYKEKDNVLFVDEKNVYERIAQFMSFEYQDTYKMISYYIAKKYNIHVNVLHHSFGMRDISTYFYFHKPNG